MALAIRHDWFLKEWLATLDMRQARLCEVTGWDKRKASDLVGCKQRYNRDAVNEAAAALNISPFELLLSPADAMAFRRLRETALAIAAEPTHAYDAEPVRLPEAKGKTAA